MLAKLTSKNQITIPKAILSQVPDSEYFDVELRDGEIILKPVSIPGRGLEGVRKKMKTLGITADTVTDAMKWAREQ